jgi:hypothetical protein
MLEEHIQSWEEAESKNIARNLSDAFDLLPGWTIFNPIPFYKKALLLNAGLQAGAGVVLLILCRSPGKKEEQRWRTFDTYYAVALLIAAFLSTIAYLRKKGRIPLILAFFVATWVTGFGAHMSYYGWSFYTYGAHNGYLVDTDRGDYLEHLRVAPKTFYREGHMRRRLLIAVGINFGSALVSLCNMFVLMLCSEAIQDRDENRPSLPKQ